jgi:hypothetical protein
LNESIARKSLKINRVEAFIGGGDTEGRIWSNWILGKAAGSKVFGGQPAGV